MSQHCTVCGNEIKVMCFKNTGVCCEICRKLRDGELARVNGELVSTKSRAYTEAPIGGPK